MSIYTQIVQSARNVRTLNHLNALQNANAASLPLAAFVQNRQHVQVDRVTDIFQKQSDQYKIINMNTNLKSKIGNRKRKAIEQLFSKCCSEKIYPFPNIENMDTVSPSQTSTPVVSTSVQSETSFDTDLAHLLTKFDFKALESLKLTESELPSTKRSNPSTTYEMNNNVSSSLPTLKHIQANSSVVLPVADHQVTLFGRFDLHGNFISFANNESNETYPDISEYFKTYPPSIHEVIHFTSLPEVLGLIADLTQTVAFIEPVII